MSAFSATSSVNGRFLSLLLKRYSRVLPCTMQASPTAYMSSDSKPPAKPPKKELKQSKPEPSKVQKAPPPPPKPQVVAEKGDTYAAGESFFSYGPYSFYDIEEPMQSRRLPQPVSR